LVRPLNAAIRRLAHITHRWQMDMEWGVAPVPEWYDTFLGQYYRWREDSVSWIWDRGVYSVLAMAPGARVLELCCGSGFFTRYFYSGRAAQVIAVDFDPRAITHARKYNAADNIRYEVADIRRSLPQGIYDNVVWDAAIEHFTEQEITEVLAQITRRLTPGGTFSGYTLQEREGLLQHPDHEYEFKSKSDLGELLLRLFRNVLVFETIYPERHNLHFIASDGPLPFDPAWPQALRLTRD
jgi:SAM-dependent methyltransferase